MTSWLFKIGLGGVQEFISQSRKTRDLAASSLLLQKLAQSLAQQATALGAEVIFPQNWDIACPHQLVLRLRRENCAQGAIREFGTDLEKALAKAWEEELPPATIVAAIDKLNSHVRGKDPSLLQPQLASALQVFWVAVPEGEDYRASVSQLLEAYELRRLTRTFPQLESAPNPLGTCAQCGVRDAVLDPQRGFKHPHFDARDKLCGVCFAKRCWSFNSKCFSAFPSTVELARHRFFALAECKDALDLLTKYGDPEAPSREFWESILPLDDDTEKQKVQDALAMRDRCPAYYAAVVFDGDEMGKWFSGSYLSPEMNLEQFQKGLSSRLADFAGTVRKCFAAWPLRVVYLGGDDGLLLTPLDYLIPLLRTLYGSWEASFGQDFRGAKTPTLSLHAAVVHQHHPLQRVVASLHTELDTTKDQGGGGCFSVSVLPHTGAPGKAIFAWREVGSLDNALSLFSSWRSSDVPPSGTVKRPDARELENRRKSRLPSRVPYLLMEGLEPFFDSNGVLPSVETEKGFRLELFRILERGERPVDPQQLKSFRDWLEQRLQSPLPRAGAPVTPREHVLGALKVIAFLARQLEWEGQP